MRKGTLFRCGEYMKCNKIMKITAAAKAELLQNNQCPENKLSEI